MIKKQAIIGLLAFFILIGVVNGAGIDNLTADVGSTYIHWSWDYNNISEAALFVDGSFITNTSLNSYSLTDLNSREYHSIELANATNHSEIYGISETKTFYPVSIFYLLIGLTVGFFIGGIFIRDQVMTLILCSLSGVLGIACFYLSFPLYLSLFSYLSLMIVALNVLWILMTVFVMIKSTSERATSLDMNKFM